MPQLQNIQHLAKLDSIHIFSSMCSCYFKTIEIVALLSKKSWHSGENSTFSSIYQRKFRNGVEFLRKSNNDKKKKNRQTNINAVLAHPSPIKPSRRQVFTNNIFNNMFLCVFFFSLTYMKCWPFQVYQGCKGNWKKMYLHIHCDI
jgi:hypothetical protein